MLNTTTGKLQQSKDRTGFKLVRLPTSNERVVEVSCGHSHTILRSTSRKVYTLGNGRNGQLGHGNFFSTDSPKPLEYPEIRNYSPLQVVAAFTSSVVLLSNRRVLWFGSNGSLKKVNIPTHLDISRRVPLFWYSSKSYQEVNMLRSECRLHGVGLCRW